LLLILPVLKALRMEAKEGFLVKPEFPVAIEDCEE
jgi:hypothetical protein